MSSRIKQSEQTLWLLTHRYHYLQSSQPVGITNNLKEANFKFNAALDTVVEAKPTLRLVQSKPHYNEKEWVMGAVRLHRPVMYIHSKSINPFTIIIPLITAYYSNRDLGGCEIIPTIDTHWARSYWVSSVDTLQPTQIAQVIFMWGIGKIPEIITVNQLNNSSKRRSQISTIITELKTCWYYIVIVLFIDWFTNLTSNIRCCTTLSY